MDRNTKICFTVLFCLQIVIIALITVYMMRRPMLESRKVMQVNNLKANDKLGGFTDQQRCEMRDNWTQAEYLNEPNIFADAKCD